MPYASPEFAPIAPDVAWRLSLCCLENARDILLALEAGDLVEVARRMFNVFEGVLPPTQQREIESIKTALLTAGALGAAMSGSGPTVFGIFKDREEADAVCGILRETDNGRLTRQVYLTRFFNKKPAR